MKSSSFLPRLAGRREEDRNLREVLDHSPIGISVVSHAGKSPQIAGNRLFVNLALSKMFGFDDPEIMLRTDISESWVNPDRLREAEKIMASKNELADFEALRRRADGSEWWVSLNSRPIVFDGIDCTAIWHLDISERKRAQEALLRSRDELEIRVEERTRVMAEEIARRQQVEDQLRHEKTRAEAAEELFGKAYRSSPALFTISNPLDGRHIEVNEAWSLITGYSRDEALKYSARELGIWAISEQRAEFVDQIKRHSFVRDFEMVLRTKDGELKDMLYSGDSVDFRGETCLLIVGQDITERKRIHQMKEDFISIASHELRTPLTSLKGALGLILGDVVGQIPDEIKPVLEIACRNSERLSRLIDDILNVEKLESGKIEFSMKPLNVRNLIDQAIKEFSGFSIKYGVSISIDPVATDQTIVGDDDRLMQVFSNLFSNACKFSPKGSEVRISMDDLEEYVRISVADKGMGVPEEFRDKIFEKFTRADNSDTADHGGTGLGLCIVKSIVEQHDGKLDFESKFGCGTTFHIDLPKADKKIRAIDLS